MNMKRIIKIIICTLIIILGIIGSYAIINDAVTPQNDVLNGQKDQMQGNNNGTIPEKPGSNISSNGTAPSGGNVTIPEKPEGNATMPQTQGNSSVPGPTGQGGTPPTGGSSNSTLGILNYLQLILCDLIIAISIIFLLMTQMGKLNLQESLEKKKMKILFLVAIILLTILLLGATILITSQINPINSTDMSQTQDNSANVVTNGVYVVDGSKTGNIITNALNGVLGTIGIKWYDVSESGKTYDSSKSDQSSIVVNNSGSLNINQATINKTSGDTSSEENSNFYGLNAAILAKTGGTLKLTNSNITTNAEGSNAVFATGTGSEITLENVKILTTSNSSRGLDATYDGTIIAKNVNITTSGAHCAALATDRGEGTVTLTNGVLETAGEGSPGIYSTGTISATNITSTATGSEAAVIEGKNSITLIDSNITGYQKHGVMIYQSASGDAAEGQGTFTMTGGVLTAKTGPLFYSTNTQSVINLENVTLNGEDMLLKASADKWGNNGSNGANVTLNAKNQILNGLIEADSISSLILNIEKNSTLNSTINANNTAQSIIMKLSSDSSWTVTGNSYLTGLTDDDNDLTNIDDNGHTIYYNKTNPYNSWLNGKTITLKDGGKLTPA